MIISTDGPLSNYHLMVLLEYYPGITGEGNKMEEKTIKIIIRLLDHRIRDITETIELMDESVTKHDYMEYATELKLAEADFIRAISRDNRERR